MISRIMQTVFASVLVGVLAITCSSLGAISSVGATIGVATGVIDERQAEGIRRTGELAERSFEEFTPEQEYYLGRAVSARIVAEYDLYEDEEANAYINNIGMILAYASDRPQLFADYRFQILESDELNAFAAPSGLVFVTRGMLRLAGSEDEVASILAHEIAHIQHRHGLQSIRTSRVTAALTSAALTGAQFATSSEIRELTAVFEDSIDDVTQTLFTAGYSRRSETEADVSAVEIMRRVGYDPRALVRFLERMQDQWNPDGPGFAQTHPSPESRIDDIRSEIRPDDPRETRERTERYHRYLGGI
ncbi:MAG: peptidase M48 [Spirochaetaceae bacterium]|nr:MAG: peptidase M48 [Spirochaetaceae bacterium]